MGAFTGALTEAYHADCQAFSPLQPATERPANGPNCTTEAQTARDRAQWIHLGEQL